MCFLLGARRFLAVVTRMYQPPPRHMPFLCQRFGTQRRTAEGEEAQPWARAGGVTLNWRLLKVPVKGKKASPSEQQVPAISVLSLLTKFSGRTGLSLLRGCIYPVRLLLSSCWVALLS